MKFIEREIFKDDDIGSKKLLGKRQRCSKEDALSYLEEECPGIAHLYRGSLFNDREFHRNHFRKMNQIRVSSINESIINNYTTKEEITYKESNPPSNDKVSTVGESLDIPAKPNSPK